MIAFATIIASVLSVTSVDATDSDTAQTETTIGNATPTIAVNDFTSPVTLTESSTVTAYATSTITDTNSCQDIISVVAVFFDDNAVNNDCSADGQNCYPIASTTCSATAGNTCDGPTDTMVQYTCSVNILHYANGGDTPDWRWYISAGDASSATGTQTSNEVSIGDLLALDITEPKIEYGTLALAATSTQKTATAENTGNHDDLDLGIKESSDFACTTGTIPSANQHYSTTTSFTYTDGTALSTTTTTLDTNISQGSDAATTPDQATYWLLVTPTSGVSGSCTGQNYFEAQ
jgi:hypothetical protein